jgi:hypothetical protein
MLDLARPSSKSFLRAQRHRPRGTVRLLALVAALLAVGVAVGR